MKSIDYAQKTQITKKQIEEIMADQAYQIQAILTLPGWKIIENIILVTKFNAEQMRRTQVKIDKDGHMALYYSGIVDGAEMARENIYGVIEKVKRIAEEKKRIQKMEEDDE